MSSKIALLRAIGYDVEGEIVTKGGKPVVDATVDEIVTLENMAILPGSTVVIVDNPLSMASYLDQHGDID